MVPSERTKGNGKDLSEHEIKLLYFEGDRALEQFAQISCGVSFSRDIKKPLACFPVQDCSNQPRALQHSLPSDAQKQLKAMKKAMRALSGIIMYLGCS